MRDLPRGTVTFLFTDVEGSTRLLKELRDGYADVLAEHQRILREAFETAGGQEIDTQGDSFFVAFRGVTYSAPGGTLSASYYGGKVVRSPHRARTTDDGLGVNFVTPPLWTPAELENAIRAGDVEKIDSGVYTWHDFVVDQHARAFCLREETAGTQLAIKAGLANRIGGVFITNARFLAYLPAVIPRTAGLPPREAFCAAEPLEP